MNQTLKRTPLYDELKIRGGKMVPFAGWEMPVQFAGIKAEHNAVRTMAGLFDVSHMGEIWLEGPGALNYAHRLVTNDILSLEEGQVAGQADFFSGRLIHGSHNFFNVVRLNIFKVAGQVLYSRSEDVPFKSGR